MKMYLISDNVDTYTGMRLAGVDGIVVHEQDELKQALERVLEDKSIGIVLLTEKFGREFPAIIDTFRLERKMPLLVEIPDRHGTGRKKDFIGGVRAVIRSRNILMDHSFKTQIQDEYDKFLFLGGDGIA